MRLFVALEIPHSAADVINHIQQQLKQEIQAERWQPLNNLHLTLHFLGEVDESIVPAIQQDMEIVTSIIRSFTLGLGYFGTFPHVQKPRVLWLGLNGNIKSLQQLHMLLGKRFDLHQGLHYDERPYKPHITLARGLRITDGALSMNKWNEQFLDGKQPHWQVEQVHLYRSELRPEGAAHTIIHSSSFDKEDGKE